MDYFVLTKYDDRCTLALLQFSLSQNCQLNRIQQIQHSLAVNAIHTHHSHAFSNLSIGSRSTHWILLSLTNKVHAASQPSYLHNLISLQPALLIYCHHFLPTNHILIENHRSLIYISSRLLNQLPNSFRQPSRPCLDSPLRPLVFVHSSTHLCHHRRSHHPLGLLLHSFTPGSKPTFSTNPSHLNLPTGLLSW